MNTILESQSCHRVSWNLPAITEQCEVIPFLILFCCGSALSGTNLDTTCHYIAFSDLQASASF